MVFCFGIRLAPYAVFSTRIFLQHIARTVESDRPLNVRPFFRSQFINGLTPGFNCWFSFAPVFQ